METSGKAISTEARALLISLGGLQALPSDLNTAFGRITRSEDEGEGGSFFLASDHHPPTPTLCG